MARPKYNTSIQICMTCCLVILFSCCKPEKPVPPAEYGTVTDVEGNVYQTIKIGDQWWMAENLKVTKYRDSSLILKVTTDTGKWNNDTVGACSVYDLPAETPGLLYNWHAVNNSKGLAPVGWHVPTDEEWKQLEKYLGMTQEEADKINFRGVDEAGKLKKDGVDAWVPYGNVWSTNESGFTALAGNCRMFDGRWGFPTDLKSTGFWWSSTEQGDEAWYRHLDYKKTTVFRYYGPKTYGFSVRCVKD